MRASERASTGGGRDLGEAKLPGGRILLLLFARGPPRRRSSTGRSRFGVSGPNRAVACEPSTMYSFVSSFDPKEYVASRQRHEAVMASSTPLPPRIIRPGFPRTRTTFQLAAELLPVPGGAGDRLHEEAVATATAWLREKFAAHLPPEADAGTSFTADVLGQSLKCIAIAEDGIWTGRLVQPDAPYPGQEAVAGRTWSTEICLRKAEGLVWFGIRVTCASLPYATEEIKLTRPRLVLDLARRFVLQDVRPLSLAPWALRTPDDLEELRSLITDPRRRLAVCLLTQPDPRRLGLETEEFLLNANDLGRRTAGMMHVVTMPMALGYQWTEMVGKPWSAYLGAVRTYRAGLRFEEDSPIDHPRILAEGLLAFQFKGLRGEEAFLELLVDQTHRHVATMLVNWGQLRFLQDAEIRRAELARQSATDDETIVTLLQAENDALNKKLEGLEDERELALSMGAEAERERERVEADNRRVRAQLDALRSAFLDRTGASADSQLSLPDSYPEIVEWVEEHLSGRLVLHPRALRGLKDAVYPDVELVSGALLLLSNEFRDRERGIPGAHEAFDTECKALGLRYGGSIARERAGEEGDTYFVRFPPNSEQQRFLEWHLRKGSGKDPRHCLAIYFCWDEVTQQVVVGWLPSHLDNRMT